MSRTTMIWRLSAFLALAAAALVAPTAVVGATGTPHHEGPMATGVVLHTYTVTTTTDDTLSSGAPAGSCHDTVTYAKCSLRAAVTAANRDFASSPSSWDVIKVPAGVYDLESSVGDDLYINEVGNLTIEGAGAGTSIINGADVIDGILQADTEFADVSVSGLTFEHGENTYGGAIELGDDDGLAVQGCSFIDDTAGDQGGAIYVPESTSATVTDSTFSSDSAVDAGGAIYQYATTGSGQTLTITGDTFSHDTTTYSTNTAANVGGGAIYAGGTATIENSTFTSDSVASAGGAVNVAGALEVESSTFTSNTATYDGGAVYGGTDVEVDGSSFTSNTATSDQGGAVYSGQAGDYTADSFSHDRAVSGGDIYADLEGTVTNSTFSHSYADSEGGAIYDEYSLGVTNSTITDPTGGGGVEGAGIYIDEGFASLVDTTITGASAPDGDGGAVYESDGSDASVEGGSYTNDTATDGYGGAFFVTDTSASNPDTWAYLTMVGSVVSNDTAEYGGGMALDGYGDASISRATFEHDSSTYGSGGGIGLEGDATLAVGDSTFADDSAIGGLGYGGAIGTEDDYGNNSVNLTNDTFTSNRALYGGALYAFESGYDIVSSTIVGNSVTEADPNGYGGALYNDDSTVFSSDTIYSGNDGTQCGGEAVSYSDGNNLDSDNSCGLRGLGDIVSHAATIGPLGMNGGPTPTMLPLAGSLAIGNGGSSCPTADQRGVTVSAGAPCDIGATFVEGTTTTLAASQGTIAKGHEQVEVFTISVKGKSSPKGTVEVLDGKTVACTATLGAAKGTTATATCSPGASTLKTGNASLTASYVGGGTNAPGISKVVKVKVT